MIELSTHIEYMLLSHDEVSVPQLGTFVVADMPSQRVEEEGIFLPPYRTVSFRHDAHEAGEDFLRSLSKVHNMSLQEARVMCVEYVDELLQTLYDEGTAGIGSMGYMLYEAELGAFSFLPAQSGIASPTLYGLDALGFAKLSRDIRQKRDKQQVRDTKVTTVVADPKTITIRINRRLFNYVASVAASVALFFAFTSPVGPSFTPDIQKADSGLLLVPATYDVPKVEKPQASVAATPVAEAEPQTVAVVQQTPVAEPVQEEAKPEAKGYAIVIASAIPRKSASSYAAKLRAEGYEAIACRFGGMSRVIIPGFASKDAAYEQIHRMHEASGEFANVWPCLLKDDVEYID